MLFFKRYMFLLPIVFTFACGISNAFAQSEVPDTLENQVKTTKSRMSNLKTALVAFRADLQLLPFSGENSDDIAAYQIGDQSGLGFSSDTNCLSTSTRSISFNKLGLSEETYNSHWKGPYMDRGPEEYMFDAWGTPFIYFRYGTGVYLWSAGSDRIFENPEKICLAEKCSVPVNSNDFLLQICPCKEIALRPDLAKMIEFAISMQR